MVERNLIAHVGFERSSVIVDLYALGFRRTRGGPGSSTGSENRRGGTRGIREGDGEGGDARSCPRTRLSGRGPSGIAPLEPDLQFTL